MHVKIYRYNLEKSYERIRREYAALVHDSVYSIFERRSKGFIGKIIGD